MQYNNLQNGGFGYIFQPAKSISAVCSTEAAQTDTF